MREYRWKKGEPQQGVPLPVEKVYNTPFILDDYLYLNGKETTQIWRLNKYIAEQGPISRGYAWDLLGISELSARVGETNRGKKRIYMQPILTSTTFSKKQEVMLYYHIN